MVGSMKSGSSSPAGGYSGAGGQDSPSESKGGPGSGAGKSSNSPSSSGNNGGLGGPTSNNSGNKSGGGGGKSSNSPSPSGVNGGLGGPTSNNSGNSNANGGGNAKSSPSSSGYNGGLGGPTSNNSGNKNSSSGGYGSTTGGGMAGPTAHDMQSASDRLASENASMSTYNAAKSLSDQNAERAAAAQQARAAETASMRDLARERALGTISKAEAGVKDPYNTLSGGLVTATPPKTVSDAIALSKTTWKGKLANVIGAYQIKDKTLQAVAKEMGLLDADWTPAVQDQLAVGLMQQRANLATVNGQIDVDKFAQELSKEWASVADPTTGVSHYAKNGIDKASISVAQAREIAKDLVANGVVTAGKSVSSITSKDVSSVQTQAPGVSRFSSTYMGSKATSAATSQQNDPSGLPAGNYPGHVVGNGIAPTFAGPKTQQQNDPGSLPPGTYPAYDPSGLPPAKPAGPTPTGVPTKAPTAAPPAAPAPAQPRSLGQKVAAAGIDIGLGMMPGVGTAVSVINGGLALTGNRTLGEHLVDSFANGEGGPGPDSGADRLGGGTKIVDGKSKSTAPKTDESFEERYLAFVDPTPRPKPSEKWNYDTPGYA